MRKISFFLMLLSITVYFSACSNRMGSDRNTTSGRTSSGGTNNTGDETGGNVGSNTNNSSSDLNMRTEFVRNAADGGMAEVQLANLALQKANSQSVKDFAQMMIDDHSKANDQLKDLATGENITIPTAISSDNQDEIDKLNKLSGNDFDKEYMDFMVKDHQKDVSMFEDASKNVSDPKMKTWIDKTLPVLRNHLDMAQSISKRVNNNE